MSTVLVTYASRMGSTREIAEAIAADLRETDHTVTCQPCAASPDADSFDAVVLGSAIYVQRWMGDALDYLRRQAPALSTRRTYLFQSGPCGTDGGGAKITPVPRAVHRIVRTFGLSEPVTFGGRLDPELATGRLTRWVATGQAGDDRDWEAIHAWGFAIGSELHKHLDRPSEQHRHAESIGTTPPYLASKRALT